ncbi:MAG: hypothetical protein AAF394_06780 [Planctomycetota bacterium]
MSGILDELVFAPASLSKYVWDFVEKAPNLGCAIAAKGSERNVAFELPFLCRNLCVERVGSDWPDFCAAIRETGLAIACPVDSLEEVPAAAVPTRMTRQHQGEALNAMEVATADLIEFSLADSNGTYWGLPQEIRKVERLGSFLDALREAAAGNTPIGVEIPLGIESPDLELIAKAGPDFLTLSHDERFGVSEATVSAAVVAIAKQTEELSLPLILNLPNVTQVEAFKYLALGVDVISIDHVIESVLPEPEDESAAYVGGRLSSMGVTAAPTKSAAIKAVSTLLESWKQALSQQLQFCGAASLADFNLDCLRANSERIQSLTGAKLRG